MEENMQHSDPLMHTQADTAEKVRAIKRSFRLLMNGDASRAMRQNGLNYKLNWGVQLPELKRMAKETGQDRSLAVELWKEDVRECRILATLIMPPTEMLPEMVDLWMEQVDNCELAEQLVHNLLQHLSFAPLLAFEWMARCETMWQYAGYLLLAKLFAQGKEPNERGINEFLDQAQTALVSDNAQLKRAARNCVERFAQLSPEYERIAQNAIKNS